MDEIIKLMRLISVYIYNYNNYKYLNIDENFYNWDK